MNEFVSLLGEPMRKRIDPHKVLVQVRVWAVEVTATVVFLVWLYHALIHELAVR